MAASVTNAAGSSRRARRSQKRRIDICPCFDHSDSVSDAIRNPDSVKNIDSVKIPPRAHEKPWW